MGFWIIIVYFILWAGLHSVLASRKAKDWAGRRFGPSSRLWYRFAFVVLATLTIAPLVVLLFLLSDRTVYSVASPWLWIMMTGQGVSFIFLVWSIMAAQPMAFIGITQLVEGPHKEKPKLTRGGLYGLVRHPMYLFSLLIMWLSPDMTVNRLALYLLMGLYFYIGSYHEEMLLETEFGKDYSVYRKQVPRLIPFFRRRNRSAKSPSA